MTMSDLLKECWAIIKPLMFDIFPKIKNADLGVIGTIGTIAAILSGILWILKYVKNKL